MQRPTRCLVLLAAALMGHPAVAAELDVRALDERLALARARYSLSEARALITEQEAAIDDGTTDDLRLLYVRSLLLVAELLRIDFEDTPKQDRVQKRAYGEQIDAVARRGLSEIESLGESALRYRLRADLYATMIRTDFQAKKYRKRMEAATATALGLDPDDARAHVTAAKPLLFAGEKRGGDAEAALAQLDQALKLEPDLEQALLLRGLAWEKLGDEAKAIADWQRALANNPQCRPARSELERLR